MTDTITIIRSPFLLLAKRIHAHGTIEPYGSARIIDLSERPVSDLDALRNLTAQLLPQPHCAAVFGGIADTARTRRVRRLAYLDAETGDQPTLRAVPHQWCALDVDGVERPASVPAADLAACAAYAVRQLPTVFHDVWCVVQASASHGIKPGCQMRLWYWLDRPTTGDELSFWLKGAPVDPCTFRVCQPIYTAAPVFVGRADHLPVRITELSGRPMVAVPPPEQLTPPEKPRRQAAPPPSGTATHESVQQILDGALRRVRNAADHAKHDTLRDNARLLGGIAEQAGLSDADLVGRLLYALPSSVNDWENARKTAAWGLAIGRQEPIEIPPKSPPKVPDPRRSETARTAFRLLRAGLAGANILTALDEQNAARPDPLTPDIVRDTARWAASQLREGTHA